MFLHYLVCSVWRTVFPTSALFTPLFSQVRQMLRPKVFQLSRILRFVLVSLPSLFVPPSIRVGILPDGRNLDREEVFLRPPKFIRMCRTTIGSTFVTPRIPILRRPRLSWPFIVASTVICILSPSLSRVLFLTISSICISGSWMQDFEWIHRGVQDPLALQFPPPPMRFWPLCIQCHRFQLHLLNLVHPFRRGQEHRPDHLLRELGCRGRVLYCRPRLFRLLLLVFHPAQRESVIDPAVDVVNAIVAGKCNSIPCSIDLIGKLTVSSHGQGGRRQV